VRQAAKSLLNLSLTFKKMRRSNPRDWGNLWLEFTYGWKPTAQTIYGTARQLLKPNADSRIENLKAHGVQRNVRTGSVADNSGILAHYRSEGSARVEFGCCYTFAQSQLDKLAGFTSLNPVSIAWEVLPYSFVVDWFVNIGGYMRNLESSFLYASNFVSGYKTVTTRLASSSQVNSSKLRSDGSQVTDNYFYNGGYTVTTKKNRTVLAGTPVPSLPVFQPKLGWSRSVSGSALLGQHLTSLKQEALELEKKRPNRTVKSAVKTVLDIVSHQKPSSRKSP